MQVCGAKRATHDHEEESDESGLFCGTLLSESPKPVVDVDPALVGGPQEAMKHAMESCSYPAPPIGAPSASKVADTVVVQNLLGGEEHEAMFVFPEAAALVRSSHIRGEAHPFLSGDVVG